MEDLKSRQKLELKELQAKTQNMKHSVPKGDKKRKKQMMAEIALLEAELQEKHQKEISDLNQAGNKQETNDLCEPLSEINICREEAPPKRISKAQKRRERKEEEEKERQKRLEAAEEENVNSARNVESNRLKKIVAQNGLRIKEIAPDGNCLYNAIADQLSGMEANYEWKSLRAMAANKLRADRDHFIPFMANVTTGEPFTEDDFENYCNDVENTNAWGGQIEIQALSTILGLSVEIFQADSPVLKIGNNCQGKAIRLSYHKHAYGLGEHYNSLVAIEE
ncbi:deubiquitinase OTUD6B-like [Rhopilema esculentum]|uniref:deubiquitinase OTUD6B-like n=1 Tax=Rhopilema esculentum TaxID=499914 RepID=UPI0031E30237|eukprot:gene1325-15721_t